ncbi:hypothetical protein Pmani_030401 [Petrolisthes manimaculis]|uniref:Uncharacterized protein n=1 Tax=Petrolisthes manimaculis TaxID=1843537 RepID=A0AAE1TSW7_9EUCA|nr:hypothetical protein Pmani_030401 [Petrolisthes manimaculis]
MTVHAFPSIRRHGCKQLESHHTLHRKVVVTAGQSLSQKSPASTQVGLSETERDGKRRTVWEELAHLTSGMKQFEKHSQRTGEELKLLHAIARVAQERQDQDKIVRGMCGLFMPCKKPITSGSHDPGSLGGGGLLSPVPTMARLIP